MVLKTIFSKPVDRPIEGVIKADDESSLRLEIEEYVLTNEIEKSFESHNEIGKLKEPEKMEKDVAEPKNTDSPIIS